MPLLDQGTLEIQERLRYSTPFWAGGVYKDEQGVWQQPIPGGFQGCCKILDTRKRLVPLVARPWQLDFDELLEGQRAEGKPMRAIVLKSRKLGFSTWVAAKFLQRLTQFPYQHGIVTAQDVKTAGIIFDMAKLAHAHLPTEAELGMGFSIRPRIIAANFSPTGRKFMEFGESSRQLRMEGRTDTSVFEIDTAGSGESGRGYTPSLLHLSEVARWEGEMAVRKMLAQLNAVPYEPETIVVLESTANSLNHFHRRWVSATEGAQDPDTGETYAALFVGWWQDPSCAREFGTREDHERFVEGIGNESEYGELAEDEPMLVERYGCTPEQLFWRRMMIRTQHSGSVELFRQEFPASAEEAFIGSGRTVFSSIFVARAIREAERAPEPVRGTLRASEVLERRSRAGTVNVPQGALWVPSDAMSAGEPTLEVWEHPRKATDPGESRDGAYFAALDVAMGEENTFTAGDYHCLTVFDHHERRQVAVHVSRMDLHLLPLWVLLVALYYNGAWLAPETNGPGIAVVDTLVKVYRYRRLFRRKRIDRLREVEESKPGWETNPATKQAMEMGFGAALEDEDTCGGLRDLPTARQLNTYVIDEKGKHRAQDGEHDDRLIAAMIAHRGMELIRPPRPKGSKKERYEPRDPLVGY